MRHMVMMFSDQTEWYGLDDAGRAEWMAAHAAAEAEAQRLGIFVDSQALAPLAAGRIVRTRGGKTVVTGGPYAETREQIGGFYLLDCTEDEAVAIARMIPDGRAGYVEVRGFYEGG